MKKNIVSPASPFLCFNFDWLFKPVLLIYKIFEQFSRLLSLWVYYFYPPYRFILDFTFLGFDLKFKLLPLLATCVWFYGIQDFSSFDFFYSLFQNCPSAVYFAVCCLYFFFRSQSGFLFSWYYSSKINTIYTPKFSAILLCYLCSFFFLLFFSVSILEKLASCWEERNIETICYKKIKIHDQFL